MELLWIWRFSTFGPLLLAPRLDRGTGPGRPSLPSRFRLAQSWGFLMSLTPASPVAANIFRQDLQTMAVARPPLTTMRMNWSDLPLTPALDASSDRACFKE